uniref:Peptidase S24/S26A/S26B/S26C domain-containing protein n=1 Tax=Thermus caliditerrae TaxID=1330700 RepID=A0A7C5VFW6_9DEIN
MLKGLPSHIPIPEDLYRPGVVAFLVTGVGLEPEIPGASFALVDTQDRRLSEGAIYVLDAAGEKHIRRAVRREGEWIFQLDDESDPSPLFLKDQVEIIGRVIAVAYGIALRGRGEA